MALADVVQQDVPIYIEAVGETRGSQTVEIRARVTGFLESMNFTEGGTVRRGQLLYQIDPKPFEATVARAKAQVAAAKAQFDNAELEEDRLRPLAESDAVSKQEYDDAFAAKQTAEASSRRPAPRNKPPLSTSGTPTSPRHSTASWDSPRPRSETWSAPERGACSPRSPRPNPIWVRFSIPEREYLRLYRQTLDARQRPRIRSRISGCTLADGSEFPAKGKPYAVTNRSVDPATGTLKSKSAFPNPNGIIRPGQFARVKVRTDMKKGALLVPQRAVRELQGNYSVAVVGADAKVNMRAVTPS